MVWGLVQYGYIILTVLEMNCSCSTVLLSISLTPTTIVIITMMQWCSVLVRRKISVYFNNHILYVVATVQNCTDWDIRLVGGSSPSQGRVEVCYMNQWGTICSSYGQTVIPAFANVICRQLGYSFLNPSVSYFGGGSGGIYLYTPTLLCTGNESRLQDCYHSPLGYHQCYNHYWDIGVVCQGNSYVYFYSGHQYSPILLQLTSPVLPTVRVVPSNWWADLSPQRAG